MDVARQLEKAIELHGSGQLQEAADLYQQILQVQPDHGDALNLLGVIHHAAGQMDNAILLIRKAIEISPDFFAPYVNLGNALQATGQLDEAVDAFEKGLSLSPGDPAAACNMASALNALGRHDDAAVAARMALDRRPDFVQALINLGNALEALVQTDEAAETYRRALTHDPDNAIVHHNLGSVLLGTGDAEGAVAHCERAVLGDPDAPEKHYNLGNALQALDRMDKAIESFRNVIQLDADYADAHSNLGAALQFLGRTEEAICAFRRALALQPENADAHWNLSLALIKNGEYEEGWREYVWRLQTPALAALRHSFETAEWTGEPLTGRCLLIEAEQGFGDAIQFARYASRLSALGAEVILECRPGLERLLGTIDSVSRVVARGDDLPPHDFHVPLLNLPLRLDTRLDTVPADIPYVSVPEGAVADPRIAAAEGLRVGIVWAGSPTRIDNAKRSADPALFEPLFDLAGATFFSLQVGDARQALEPYLPARDNVIDLADGLSDFADTAAQVAALDLVITVDTAALHLAGALGKPVWGLMSFPVGFMWMEGRDDSPWYPTLRLFRPAAPGDWASVFDPVKEELAGLIAG